MPMPQIVDTLPLRPRSPCSRLPWMSEIVDRIQPEVADIPLSDAITQRLREAIITGELQPGAKLSEPELAQRFGIGRGSLREALQRLEGMRLVERRPRVGARVAALGLGELIELYTIREALEGLACRLAAEVMAEHEIAEVRRLLDHHAQLPDTWVRSPDAVADGQLDFHVHVVRGSGNHELELMINDLSYRVRRYRYRSRHIRERPHQGLREHYRILDAIEARDGELADLLMRRHIRSTRRSIEAALADED